MSFLSPLPDDLAEIARSIPRTPRTYSALRALLALLPNPLAAGLQPSFPVATVDAPVSDPVEAEQAIGTVPGTTLMDGSIHSGQIGPGAVTGAKFASTVKPVILVHGLPTLPDANYPVDTFVYDIDAVPKSLWKNVANVWTRAIGPSDIQADSITAGQIAAGAVSTSELAVGARLTGEVANETGLTPGVFIDSTGILIRSGKLTLQDEFGLTSMAASGFTGNWAEFLALGLYNGLFSAGATGSLPTGRTASLPYWNVAKDAGTPTLTRTADTAYPGGYRLRATFNAVNDIVSIASDKVVVIGGHTYALAFVVGSDTVAGEVDFRWQIDYYDAADAFISTDGPFGFAMGDLAAGHRIAGNFSIAPITARKAVLKAGFKELTTHNAGNYGEVGLLAFTATPLGLDDTGDVTYTTGTIIVEDVLSAFGTFSAIGRERHGGVSFPSSVISGDTFYRQDLDGWYQWDGTRWLSTQLYEMHGSSAETGAITGSSDLAFYPYMGGDPDVWWVDIRWVYRVSTTHNGSNYWQLEMKDGTGNLVVLTTDKSTVGTFVNPSPTAIGALGAGSGGLVYFHFVKQGGPGGLEVGAVARYRRVAT